MITSDVVDSTDDNLPVTSAQPYGTTITISSSSLAQDLASPPLVCIAGCQKIWLGRLCSGIHSHRGIFLTFWHLLRERQKAGQGPNHQAHQNQTIFFEQLSIECAWDYYCLPTRYWSWLCEAHSLFTATYKNERSLLLLKVNIVCLFNWIEMGLYFPNVIVNKFSKESEWWVCRREG